MAAEKEIRLKQSEEQIKASELMTRQAIFTAQGKLGAAAELGKDITTLLDKVRSITPEEATEGEEAGRTGTTLLEKVQKLFKEYDFEDTPLPTYLRQVKEDAVRNRDENIMRIFNVPLETEKKPEVLISEEEREVPTVSRIQAEVQLPLGEAKETEKVSPEAEAEEETLTELFFRGTLLDEDEVSPAKAEEPVAPSAEVERRESKAEEKEEVPGEAERRKLQDLSEREVEILSAIFEVRTDGKGFENGTLKKIASKIDKEMLAKIEDSDERSKKLKSSISNVSVSCRRVAQKIDDLGNDLSNLPERLREFMKMVKSHDLYSKLSVSDIANIARRWMTFEEVLAESKELKEVTKSTPKIDLAAGVETRVLPGGERISSIPGVSAVSFRPEEQKTDEITPLTDKDTYLLAKFLARQREVVTDEDRVAVSGALNTSDVDESLITEEDEEAFRQRMQRLQRNSREALIANRDNEAAASLLMVAFDLDPEVLSRLRSDEQQIGKDPNINEKKRTS